jgi:hypothetical protein
LQQEIVKLTFQARDNGHEAMKKIRRAREAESLSVYFTHFDAVDVFALFGINIESQGGGKVVYPCLEKL